MPNMTIQIYCLIHVLLAVNCLSLWPYHRCIEAIAYFVMAVLVLVLYRQHPDRSAS